MIDFALSRAESAEEASRQAAAARTAQQGADIRFVAGGTTLIDLMKLGVEAPQRVIDIHRLPLADVELQPDGSLRIGAMLRNSDLANHPLVRREYPVLSEALLSGASAQLRNMATTGGNLLQRTRCPYFRDPGYSQCNKRAPGSGCAALLGPHRTAAVLGTSDHCIATHPSDMAVAMTALEARVHVLGSGGERAVPIEEFFLLPGATPDHENVLQPGDLVTHVTLPKLAAGVRSHYLKLRDRASYEFALASAAVVVHVKEGRIRSARVALGGIGTRPWRSPEAERELAGALPREEVFRRAATAALREALPRHDNAFKIELARRCLVRALTTATA